MKTKIFNASIWKVFLTIIRLYLGWTWFRAGLEKLTGTSFSAGGFIKGAISKTSGPHPSVQIWWADFLQHVAVPNMAIFNSLIPWGEFLVGLSLLFGVLTKFGVLMGIFMNFSYMLSGSVSTNPQMLLLEIIVFIHSTNAAKIGLDFWVMPKIKILSSSFKDSGYGFGPSKSAEVE